MLPRYEYHKPFKVKFPDKCGRQNRFNPDNKGGLVLYTDGLGCMDGARDVGTASVLGSTLQYSRLNMLLRPV